MHIVLQWRETCLQKKMFRLDWFYGDADRGADRADVIKPLCALLIAQGFVV